jgi:hypothetical protein
MFDVKNEVNTDEDIVPWRRFSRTQVTKSVVVIDLVHLKTERCFPEIVAIVNIFHIELECMFATDGKVVAEFEFGTMTVLVHFCLMDHASKFLGARCDAIKLFPARRGEEIVVTGIFGACMTGLALIITE